MPTSDKDTAEALIQFWAAVYGGLVILAALTVAITPFA